MKSAIRPIIDGREIMMHSSENFHCSWILPSIT